MASLVSTTDAKTYLRLTVTDWDTELAMKHAQATDIVLDYVNPPATAWTTGTVPDLVKAAILEVTKNLFDGETEPLSPAVKNILRRYRDPALA